MRVCLGGTFHPLHIGHEALLREACRDATAVFVGVTDGDLSNRPDRDTSSWEERADAVAHFFAAEGFQGDLEINHLTDGVGPAASKDYDAIVVSPETVPGATAINARRIEAGLSPLEIRVVPHVVAKDFRVVSGTRIEAGDLDRGGKRLTPLRVAVGSGNPVKVDGVQRALERVFPGLPLDVQGHAVASGVPEQPRLEEIMVGAGNRATAAMEAWPDADYAVGIEAGLDQDEDGDWYDVQTCQILDADGGWSKGHGPAFQYPSWVTERALAGEMVSDIVGPVANDERIGGTTGAIGFLTDGRYMRTEFTEQAVLMAFVPRVRRELYS